MSYYDDLRVRGGQCRNDSETLSIEIDGVEQPLPTKFEVCPTCQGRGSHVNPSIDANGLTAEDFAEDPDFREAYFDGSYDVGCYQCGGKRVVPVVDRDRCSPQLLERYDAHLAEEEEYQAIVRAEQRMGA